MPNLIHVRYLGEKNSQRINMTVDLEQLLARQELADGKGVILRSSGKSGILELEFNQAGKEKSNA
jgi:hypothetical protein